MYCSKCGSQIIDSNDKDENYDDSLKGLKTLYVATGGGKEDFLL